MPISDKIPTVNFATARETMLAAVLADVPGLLLGDPGIGKSSLFEALGEQVGLPTSILLGSTLDPTDIGGALVVRLDGKGVDRVPLAVIHQACEEARLLVLDEFNCAPNAVQATELRLVLSRVAGDRHLHSGTRVMLAGNPPEQAPAGIDFSAPLMGRVCALHLRPDHKEVVDWFLAYGAEGSPQRAEATDFALTAQQMPDLLQIAIPPNCVTGNEPWGAPRAWERVVKARAACAGTSISEDAAHAIMAGNVGQECAIGYGAVLKLRKNLPSVPEIVKDPKGAPLPEDMKLQIAALGLIARVADENTWAAWIYASRLRPELATASMSMLIMRKDSALTAPHAKDGSQVRINMVAKIKRIK